MKRKNCTIILFCLIFLVIIKIYYYGHLVDEIEDKSNDKRTCPIPDFSNPSEFYKPFPNLEKFKCDSKEFIQLVKLKDGLIYMVKPMECIYQCVKRNSDFSSVLDSKHVIHDGMKIPCSYFLVKCIDEKIEKRQFIYTIYKDEKLINECSKNVTRKYDIMIVSFDSMSYRAWKYYLPKSYHLVHNVLGGVGFKKFNIVGDGTTANIQALLTGTKDTETYETRRRIPGAKFVDDYNWIFKEFKANKYVTMYQEEMTDLGTFQYRLKGFDKQPTDFYGRTGLMYAEKHEVKNNCLGNKLFEEVQLDMLKDFSYQYQKSNTFSFTFMGLLSHNENQFVHLMDDVLAKFLEEQRRLYPNKLIILSADHGHRSYSRQQLEGKFEERLPYLAILLPNDLISQYQANLIHNSDILITPLDVHATMQHILYGSDFGNTQKLLNKAQKLRHQSLLNPLSKYRSCNDVNLPPHWCACLKWSNLDISSNEILLNEIGNQAIKQIVKYTDPWRHICSSLTFSRVKSASLLQANPSVLAFKNSRDMDGYVPDLTDTMRQKKLWLRVLIEAHPFKALFETTVTFNKDEKPVRINELNFREIGRLDRYAPYIGCLTPKNLNSGHLKKEHDSMTTQISDIRKFCICKHNLVI